MRAVIGNRHHSRVQEVAGGGGLFFYRRVHHCLGKELGSEGTRCDDRGSKWMVGDGLIFGLSWNESSSIRKILDRNIAAISLESMCMRISFAARVGNTTSKLIQSG